MNNFWNNKNVLVTGHTGFKGSWISLYLKFLGANVYGLSSSELDGVYKLANVSSIISNECFIDLSIHNQRKKDFIFYGRNKSRYSFSLCCSKLSS